VLSRKSLIQLSCFLSVIDGLDTIAYHRIRVKQAKKTPGPKTEGRV